MKNARIRAVAAVLFVIALSVGARPGGGLQGQERRRVGLVAVGAAALRVWDAQVDRMIRSGDLQLRLERADTLMPGRRHTRFTQMVRGVPVYGGDIARQVDAKG